MSRGEGMSRREFLASAVAMLGVLGGTGYLAKSEMNKTKEEVDKKNKQPEPEVKKYSESEMKELVTAEKVKVKLDISKGLEDQQDCERLISEYNTKVKELDLMDEKSEEYKILSSTLSRISRQFRVYYVRREGNSFALLKDANESAVALRDDEIACDNLAIVRVELEKYGVDLHEPGSKGILRYWHNLSAAYLELGKLSSEVVSSKMEALLKMRAGNPKAFPMQPEYILFYLLCDNFDLTLDHAKVKAQLDKEAPDWKNFPATHNNKESYQNYNILSTLNIFELNQLVEVVRQFKRKDFCDALFEGRDTDLSDRYSELGGNIPLSNKSDKPEIVAPKDKHGNGSYITPSLQIVNSFKSAAKFHFHATKESVSVDVQGPSGGDDAFFVPGVVFSSVDNDTILAHFFVTRFEDSEQIKNDVICLGTIEKTK